MKALKYQLGTWRIRDGERNLLGKKFVVANERGIVALIEGADADTNARVISIAPLMLDFVHRYKQMTHAIDMGPEHKLFRADAERLLSVAEGNPK